MEKCTTRNHKVAVKRKGWIEIKDLKIDDIILQPKEKDLKVLAAFKKGLFVTNGTDLQEIKIIQ